MWNSYVNKDIIERIKCLLKENEEWFYFRKNNKRMENENIYTALVYLQYELNNNNTLKPFEYYKIGDRLILGLNLKQKLQKFLNLLIQ